MGAMVIGASFLLTTTVDNLSRCYTSLLSYTWQEIGKRVTDLQSRVSVGSDRVSGSLTVSYIFDIDNRTFDGKTHLWHQWSTPDDTEFKAWEATYRIGNHITILSDGNGQSSIGHWPTQYTWVWGLGSLLNMVLAVQCVQKSRQVS